MTPVLLQSNPCATNSQQVANTPERIYIISGVFDTFPFFKKFVCHLCDKARIIGLCVGGCDSLRSWKFYARFDGLSNNIKMFTQK